MMLIHWQSSISCFIHLQTHSEIGNRKKNIQFNHKEHKSEHWGGGNSSYGVHLVLLADNLFGTMTPVQDTLRRAMGSNPEKSAPTTLCAMFIGKIRKIESSAKLLWNSRTKTTAKIISVVQLGYLHKKFSTTLYAFTCKCKYTTNITALFN